MNQRKGAATESVSLWRACVWIAVDSALLSSRLIRLDRLLRAK